MTQHKSKFHPPKFTGQPGFKNTDHGPGSGYIERIVAALAAGTSAALKAYRNPVSYKGSPPRWQPSDVSAPIEARPSSEISEPVDLSGVSDLTRDIGNDPPPIHPSMKR